MWREFKAFVARGNVFDLAVGIIIGAAFGKIVDSLVNDIVMPPIGLLLGGLDFSNLFINLSGKPYASLAEARAAGAAVIAYGVFINTVISFLVVSFVVFLLVKGINRLKSNPPKEPTSKQCPYCFRSIPIKATRCPECTSLLTANPVAEGR